MRNLFGLLMLAALVQACATSTSTPLATFECSEKLGLDWPRTLVTYQLQRSEVRGQRSDTAAGPAVVLRQAVKQNDLRLVDGQTNDVPFQLSKVTKDRRGNIESARLSFFAELPKGGDYRYELLKAKRQEGSGKRDDNRLIVSTVEGYLTLDNSLIALRLPPAGDHQFEKPLAFGQDHAQMLAGYGKQTAAGLAPGPIQGVRLVDGRWAGGSYFFATDLETAPKVTGYTCRVTEQGPLFVEAVVRYQFDNGGFYQLTARLLEGEAVAQIDEQSDLKTVGNEWQWRVMFSLTGGWQADGWRPDTTFWRTSEGRLPGRDAAFEGAMAARGFDTNAFQSVEFGCKKIAYDEPYAKVFDTAVWYPWHPNAHYFGLLDSRALAGDAKAEQIPFVGVVPMHAGNWRMAVSAFNGMVFSYQAGDVCLNWPLVTAPHPKTLLHTGEYDTSLPFSFLRRQWALLGGGLKYHEQLNHFRVYDGFVNLDDYKEWVLDWPADPKVTWPRLVFGREDVERLRNQLDQHPGGEVLKQHLYVNDTDERREQLFKQVTYPGDWSGPLGQTLAGLRHWNSSFRQSQMAGWAGAVDEMLSSGKLTVEQRQTVRTHVAAVCSLLSEPDFNPRGAMMHLGNPNMPMNRFFGLTFGAALIPDHPRAAEWLDVSEAYLRYKLAMNVAPAGAWSELITYFGASAPHVMQAAAVLERTGRLKESTARLASLPAVFTLNLLSPTDPRFGTRTMPNWGHEGYDITTHWLVASVLMRRLDPELATALAWAWRELGKPMEQHHDAGFSERVILHADLLKNLQGASVPKGIDGAWFPGFGANLRAHAGDPLETMLSYRQGYMVSHCDPNQGDFFLYAKGAPLVTLCLFAYPIHQHQPYIDLNKDFGWNNRVRFGSRGNDGGWPGGGMVSQVHAWSYGDSVDYLRGVGDYPPQRWTRQVLFLKGKTAAGPNYFLFRDSFEPVGEGADAAKLDPKWWYLRTEGARELLSAGKAGLSYASPFGPKLDVRFLQPAEVAAETRQASREGPLYNQAAINWRNAGSPIVKDHHRTNLTVEETLTITAVGPIAPGQDILVALYPQGQDEAPPQYELLGDGAAKITTSEGTDYVFVGRQPMKVAQGDVSFEGLTGAVRVYPNEVHLVISEGPAVVSYRGTTLRSAGPAVKIVPTAELAKAQTFEIPAPPAKLKDAALPEGCTLAGHARCELTVEPERLIGRSEGQGGFLFAPMPPELKVLPMLVIDGQTYAPGTSGGTLIIPLLPGEHRFEVRALDQPSIFRNWQAW